MQDGSSEDAKERNGSAKAYQGESGQRFNHASLSLCNGPFTERYKLLVAHCVNVGPLFGAQHMIQDLIDVAAYTLVKCRRWWESDGFRCASTHRVRFVSRSDTSFYDGVSMIHKPKMRHQASKIQAAMSQARRSKVLTLRYLRVLSIRPMLTALKQRSKVQVVNRMNRQVCHR
jgi:hypothetical protein